MKNIIKEIIIVLLLALAIILILGVILYEYVPSNKIVPETVSYVTPEEVQQEIQTEENIDDAEVVITYKIDSTDLNNYKRIQEYVPGKKNPFAMVREETSEDGNTITNGNTVQDGSSIGTGYLPDKGTK